MKRSPGVRANISMVISVIVIGTECGESPRVCRKEEERGAEHAPVRRQTGPAENARIQMHKTQNSAASWRC